MRTERCEVIVVGGGPVGLLLGCSLAQAGIDVRVLERDQTPRPASRAIGIHPPGLRCLDAIGVAETLVSRGVRVLRGHAAADQRSLGAISFTSLPAPFAFVLSVPQSETEQVLQARLHALAPDALWRGVTFIGCEQERHEVHVRVDKAGRAHALTASFVIGCDGKHSEVRKAVGLACRGGPYPACFIMGDLTDDTGFGADATVFLSASGLLESFPLPHARRRWVASTGNTRVTADAATLVNLVAERSGHTPTAAGATLVSTFTAERSLASSFVDDRVALAGDAAHVVSPIGGQGMNLGWLDAAALARTLYRCLREGGDHRALLARYGSERRNAAQKAIARAEWFMRIGACGKAWHPLRDACVRTILSPWLAPRVADVFTMRGLS